MILLRLMTIVFCLWLCAGCGERRIEITRDMRRTIDTLSAREIYSLRPVLDSICQTKMDSIVSIKTDSILAIRRDEIRKLLGQ